MTRTLDLSDCLVDRVPSKRPEHRGQTDRERERLRLSVTRGTNIGKDADVGAYVLFSRSSIFYHNLQLLTLSQQATDREQL